MTDLHTNPADAERALLGYAISGRNVLGLVSAADFYNPGHAAVWQAAQRIDTDGGKPDPLTIERALDGQRLPCESVATWLAEMFAAALTAADPHTLAKLITDASARRRLQEVAVKLQQLASTDRNADELIDIALGELASGQRSKGTTRTMASVVPDVLDRAQHGVAGGIETPWPDLTDKINGWQPGTLNIVGARPSVGKSLIAQAAAVGAASAGSTVLMVSAEMSQVELGTRMLADAASVDLSKLLAARLSERDWGQVAAVTEKLSALPIEFLDDPGATVSTIRASARALHRRGQLGLVVVDYLQLLTPIDRRAPREQQVSEMSRSLKRLAMELHIPVIALAQLNRGSVQRQDRRPVISDLRESGAIEQDADVVLLLHRDEDDASELLVIVDKNRNGPKGEFPLRVFGHYARVSSAWRGSVA